MEGRKNREGRIFLWWLFRGCSPLPIPNREVKPHMANGTALSCGRVGSCHILFKKPLLNAKAFCVNGRERRPDNQKEKPSLSVTGRFKVKLLPSRYLRGS